MFFLVIFKKLSKQKYLQLIFKLARGIFMQTYDPSDTWETLKKIAAPFAWLFTTAFGFHLIKEALKLVGNPTADDWGDMAGIAGMLSMMYPVYLFPNLTFKQMKRIPVERININDDLPRRIAKYVRSNSHSFIQSGKLSKILKFHFKVLFFFSGFCTQIFKTKNINQFR